MLFNSLDFAIFLPIVFLLYWFVVHRNLRLQNAFIVVASYIFYGWWDWRFLLLIIFSTFVDYSVGYLLHRQEKKRHRKLLLSISILVNLGFLAVFKYYNFFLENFVEAYSFIGGSIRPSSLSLILPVGISFYTFQTLSYTIDIYNRKLQPTKDFIAFSAFVCFFPQLVAGPIERATHLLPQFLQKRSFEYNQAVNGLRQILWGLFKKVVIADNCARYADIIFNSSEDASGSTLVVGAVFFAFQIYGDFSGYSDIAIGTSRLFGFDLMNNFNYPYFSRDIAEFWRRWHISLSTWFRDYLYIPLGGSLGSTWKKVRNIFIIFLVSGFWHGANWTFIAWGALNALYFLPLMVTKRNRKFMGRIAVGKDLPSLHEFAQIALTFMLTCFAWIFFRARDLAHAFQYIGGIFDASLFQFPTFHLDSEVRPLLLLLGAFMIMEWLGRDDAFAIENIGTPWPKPVRWSVYFGIVFLLFYFTGEQQQFIYFQF
ncbi:MBOAT family protein [Flavobacteriaceae bacterium TK19130]|nr:MBOAT family protein [Thermobacterium salinum]